MTIRSTSTKVTPDIAAKHWAAGHPDAAGTLTVQSYTPAGAGGWKIKTKETLFYVAFGKAAKTLHTRSFTDAWVTVSAHNGVCCICGGLFLTPSISEYTTQDNYIVEACPLCSCEQKLRTPNGGLRHGRHPLLDKWTRWGTPTPAAAERGIARVWEEYTVDIRPLQSNLGQQLAHTALVIGA